MKNIHISIITHIIGICLIAEGVFIFFDILISTIFHDGLLIPLLESTFITLFFGFSFYLSTKPKIYNKPSIKESFLIVTLSWVFISLFGTLPYLLSNSIPNFTDAFFETVSGFTTTGSSIITDIEALPKSILFWRSETHWIGGMGIIALVITVLPSSQISKNHLFSAEGSFFNTEKIQPRLIDVVKRVWLIYIILTIIESISLMLAGMNWFDAICHSFATIATGGFSTQNNSVVDYSPTIQYILILFMFLSGINFILHYLFVLGKIKKVFQNEELKAYFLITIIITLLLSYSNFSVYQSVEVSFRQSLFQVVSILTATGFSSTDYEQWAYFAQHLLFFTMFIGACVGSTGGGIKIARHIILIKSLKAHIKKAIHPNAVTPIRFNKKVLTERQLSSTSSFIIIYLLTFVFGLFIMMATGLDPKSASSSVITTLGGIGPGYGSIGPMNNFAEISELGKYYLSFNMILGRLEIISVLSLFTGSFYKI